MNKDQIPASRKNDLVQQELEGELLIYDINVNKAFCLNETSARVWQACDGVRTVEEISSMIGNDDVVRLALDQLHEENLLEGGSVLPETFTGMSRRQAIAKAGLASMIAIPIVASLMVPKSVYAQASLLPVGAICTTSSQCTLNNQGLQCCRSGLCANGIGGCS